MRIVQFNKALIYSVPFLLGGCFSTPKSNCDYTQKGINYVGRNSEECKLIDYKCPDRWKSFEDSCGCGCYEMDIETYVNEILEDNPIQDNIDVSNMKPFVVVDEEISLTFYLRQNQRMESDGNEIKFYTTDFIEVLPVKVLVKDLPSEKYTLSGSGCSLSKKGVLFTAGKWNEEGFKLLVSIMDDNGAVKNSNSFKIHVLPE